MSQGEGHCCHYPDVKPRNGKQVPDPGPIKILPGFIGYPGSVTNNEGFQDALDFRVP